VVCPVCNVEAVITAQHIVYSQEEGKLYRVLRYSCRNKKCKQFNKELDEEVRTELPFTVE
jgi:V8-like Glu-specific endopeptidase